MQTGGGYNSSGESENYLLAKKDYAI